LEAIQERNIFTPYATIQKLQERPDKTLYLLTAVELVSPSYGRDYHAAAAVWVEGEKRGDFEWLVRGGGIRFRLGTQNLVTNVDELILEMAKDELVAKLNI
jgi:hypothetical protein